ncbi:MAG: hypothetical protein ABI406_15820 [Ktedonobacteraceae bacterium]
MPFVLWTVLCLIAYSGGIVILVWATPHLLARSYDEVLFMGIAAADVFGGMLVFGAVAFTFGIFSGNFGSRVLDFLLLVGILIAGGRMSIRSFRSRYYSGTSLSSCIIAGSYGVFLALASLFYLVMLLVPSS